MKKMILMMGVGLLIVQASVYAADIPYSDIASVLREANQVTNAVRLVSSSAANEIQPYMDSVKSLGVLIANLETFEQDISKATTAAKKFPWIVKCSKKSPADRKTFSSGGKLVCGPVGCSGSRAECLKAALAELRTILKPLLTDIFIGYDVNGKKVDPLAMTILDVVQQPGAKEALNSTVNVMKTILNIIDELDNLIK